jgi:hypothetical protein
MPAIMDWSISTRPTGFREACMRAHTRSASASSRSGSGPSLAVSAAYRSACAGRRCALTLVARRGSRKHSKRQQSQNTSAAVRTALMRGGH